MTVTPVLEPAVRAALGELLLAVADDELVIGFWDSEWTGIAPMLEEDVAMSSISQDEIGHARAWYELLADLTDDDADRIAFGREPDAYRHAALMNHPRTDWAFTVARRHLYEHADALRLEALMRSSHAPVAELAARIAGHSRAVNALGKRLFYEQIERGIEDAYALAGDGMACNMTYEDAAEGIEAFLTKRAPVWRGR